MEVNAYDAKRWPQMSQAIDLSVNPAEDWITQAELARILGISQKTARKHALDGRLEQFAHGIPAAGRRIYSRELFRRQMDRYLLSSEDRQ